jgi:hypothetical protein
MKNVMNSTEVGVFAVSVIEMYLENVFIAKHGILFV